MCNVNITGEMSEKDLASLALLYPTQLSIKNIPRQGEGEALCMTQFLGNILIEPLLVATFQIFAHKNILILKNPISI